MRRASIRFGQLAGNIRRYSEKHHRDQGHIASRLKRILPDFEHRQTTMPPQVEAGHGQIETRTATVSAGVAWLQQQRQRPGLQAAGKVVRMRETAEKATTETAYDLLSKPLAAGALVLYHAVAHLKPTIFTGCPAGQWAQPRKIAWAHRHFPGVPVIACASREKFRHMAHPGDVLVDDYPRYKDLWEQAGGIFVLHTSARESIRKLAELGVDARPQRARVKRA